jgi:uncharacterized protein YkwD
MNDEFRDHLSRRLVVFGGLGGLLPAALAVPALARGYRAFAQSLVENLPAGAQFRPDLEDELLKLANGYRARNGLRALQAGDNFHMAARAQAVDMMEHNFIGHSASDGTPFEARMRAIDGGVQRFGTVGENAARDSKKTPADAGKAAALFQQWVDSRPHRANLKKGDYVSVATGVVQKGTTIWAIQIFWGAERKGLFFGGQAAPGASPSQ